MTSLVVSILALVMATASLAVSARQAFGWAGFALAIAFVAAGISALLLCFRLMGWL